MLAGFDAQELTFLDETRTVFFRGEGPGVVVMHEVPGLTEGVAGFGRRLADEGFRVALPSLFGAVGEPFRVRDCAPILARACIGRELHVLASRRSSPITRWLRALCRWVHEERRAAGVSARGVGALGMCLTGNFALALAVDPWLMAPVLSQPSLPFAVTPDHAAGIHVSADDLATLKRRARDEDLRVLGLRFTHDPMCPRARFDTLEAELGDAFEPVEIDSGPGNPYGVAPIAHSVLVLDFVDRGGHPTRAAYERVVSFLRESLST